MRQTSLSRSKRIKEGMPCDEIPIVLRWSFGISHIITWTSCLYRDSLCIIWFVPSPNSDDDNTSHRRNAYLTSSCVCNGYLSISLTFQNSHLLLSAGSTWCWVNPGQDNSSSCRIWARMMPIIRWGETPPFQKDRALSWLDKLQHIIRTSQIIHTSSPHHLLLQYARVLLPMHKNRDPYHRVPLPP